MILSDKELIIWIYKGSSELFHGSACGGPLSSLSQNVTPSVLRTHHNYVGVCVCVCSVIRHPAVLSLVWQFTAQNAFLTIILSLHAAGDKHSACRIRVSYTLVHVTILFQLGQLFKQEIVLKGKLRKTINIVLLLSCFWLAKSLDIMFYWSSLDSPSEGLWRGICSKLIQSRWHHYQQTSAGLI